MPKKILIVEDEPLIRDMMKTRLGMEGYDIILARDGNEGIEKAEKEKPDIVLLDIMLPDIDGFNVCDTIKLKKKLQTKVIMMTSKIDAVDAGRALRSGADDFTVKTTDYAKIIEAIKKIT